MDDLISELHEWTQDLDIQDCGADGVLFRAIDRIEQLEGTMIWVLGTIGADHPAKKVIRVALGEKKND